MVLYKINVIIYKHFSKQKIPINKIDIYWTLHIINAIRLTPIVTINAKLNIDHTSPARSRVKNLQQVEHSQSRCACVVYMGVCAHKINSLWFVKSRLQQFTETGCAWNIQQSFEHLLCVRHGAKSWSYKDQVLI